MKKLLCLAGLLSVLNSLAQDCPTFLFPAEGQAGVSVAATISWSEVLGVTAYSISIGTTPGGTELLPVTSVGSATSYTRPQGLPDNQPIYVSLFIFTLSQGNRFCSSLSFRTEDITTPPGCTELLSPAPDSQDVPVGTVLRWTYSLTATAYRIDVGTTPGGSELGADILVGDALQYKPDPDLPPETEIFVRITPENENGDAGTCIERSFTTGPLATLPGCSQIQYPADGTGNVPLSPLLEWSPVPGAEGYIVSIGSSPFENDVLDRADLRDNTSTNVINFEPNRVYFIRIIPYNLAGEAIGCQSTSFSTIAGCGPFFDAAGNLVDLNPAINFPERVGVCLGQQPEPLVAQDEAEGYRWFLVESPGRERLLDEGREFTPPGEGTYRLELFDTYLSPTGEFECTASQVFTVTASEIPQIEDTRATLGNGQLTINVDVSGSGDYEFALNNPSGPYQPENRFDNLPVDTYTVYVRDRNGCGTVQAVVEPDLSVTGFPRFFTPNGDGINDFWQFILPPSGINPVRRLSIFDRYGNFLVRVEPSSDGWDGMANGRPMPPSDYWFRAVNTNGQVVQGHFTLKR